MALTNDPHIMRLETFRPGDASITVSRPDVVRELFVEVRQDRKGPVARRAADEADGELKVLFRFTTKRAARGPTRRMFFPAAPSTRSWADV